MKCKECKEIIPDNRKYCPECGALLNNIKYDIYNTNNYNPVQQNTNYKPSPVYSAPKNAKKSFTNRKEIVIIAIFIAFSIIPVLFTLFDSTDSEDGFFFENSFPVTPIYEYENRAIDYVQNFFESEENQSYFDFNYNTTIDWDFLCADLPAFSGIENANENLREFFQVFCQNDINEIFRRSEDIEYMEFSRISSSTLSEYELDTYVDILNSKLSPYGLTAEDYFDYDGIENIYEVQVAASGMDNDNNTVVEGFYTVIIAESYGFYDVLYDDYFIENFIASITAGIDPYTT